jgi:hypothetical protein
MKTVPIIRSVAPHPLSLFSRFGGSCQAFVRDFAWPINGQWDSNVLTAEMVDMMSVAAFGHEPKRGAMNGSGCNLLRDRNGVHAARRQASHEGTGEQDEVLTIVFPHD